MKIRFLGLLIGASYLVATGPALAVNKCVDKYGKVAYSDRPCAGATAVFKLEVPTAPPADTASQSSLATSPPLPPIKGAGSTGEDKEAARKQAAHERGLPSGTGWYMHEDWYRHGDGRMTTSVICNAKSSVGLIRKRPILDRIYTSMTGDEYFVTIDAAAKKACGLIGRN